MFCQLSYIAFEELIDHPQDQPGPEDVQSLQQHQHGIKEVVASKGFKGLHGQHQGGMNDSVGRAILDTSEPVQHQVHERQRPRVILTS